MDSQKTTKNQLQVSNMSFFVVYVNKKLGDWQAHLAEGGCRAIIDEMIALPKDSSNFSVTSRW